MIVTKKTNACLNVWKEKSLFTADGSINKSIRNYESHYENQYKFLKKLKIELPHNPDEPYDWICKWLMSYYRHGDTSIYCYTTHNSKKLMNKDGLKL